VTLAAAGPVHAADEVPEAGADSVLEDAWWETARMIGEREPWGACAERLEEALADAGEAPSAARCRDLLASLRLAEVTAVGTNDLDDDTPVAALLVALQDVRIGHAQVLRPLLVFSQEDRLLWEVLAEHSRTGPESAASRLFGRGRSVVPQLIAALDDQRATRTVSADRSHYAEPLVVRVGDLALALIEAISLCRFHLDPVEYHPRSQGSPLISEWAEARRAEQIAVVQKWWQATRDLPAGDATFLRLEKVERKQQIEMLDAMIETGRMRAEALRFLLPRYRNGWEIDRDLSLRTLRAGGRAPLEFVHEAVQAGRVVDQDMVKLIAEFGNIDDFKLLRGAIRGTSKELPTDASELPEINQHMAKHIGELGNTDEAKLRELLIRRYAKESPKNASDESPEIDLGMVMQMLNYVDDPLAVPVLVAVIERSSESPADSSKTPAGAADAAPHALRAAERIEMLTGKDFGFLRARPPQMTARGFEEILRWWLREGKGAFDYEQVRPHAPGGIR
jgi:hypothetical protein